MSSQTALTWPSIALFVRHLTHDVRNHLNGLELEAALLADSVSDPEATESVSRMREQLHNLAGELRGLAAKFCEPSPTVSPIGAAELYLIFQEQAAAMKDLAIDFTHTLHEEVIEVDANEVSQAANELLRNAAHFGPEEHLKLVAHADPKAVVYELRQKKKEPINTEAWGYSPFLSHRRGAYGLGLWDVRRIIEANGGTVEHRYAPETRDLVSRLTFPIAKN